MADFVDSSYHHNMSNILARSETTAFSTILQRSSKPEYRADGPIGITAGRSLKAVLALGTDVVWIDMHWVTSQEATTQVKHRQRMIAVRMQGNPQTKIFGLELRGISSGKLPRHEMAGTSR